MSWEWIALILLIGVGILLIIFRNTHFVKTNWKYALILLPLFFLVVLKIIMSIRNRTEPGSPAGSSVGSSNDLDRNIINLKDRIVEVQMETAIEVSAAKTKNEEVIKKLEKIKSIPDTSERRKQLAALMG